MTQTVTLFIGGLPPYVSESDVKSILETIGPVQDIRVIQDRKTGKGRGYAFFKTDAELEGCFLKKKLEYQGQELHIRDAKVSTTPVDGDQTTRAYYRFNQLEVDKDDLKAYFSHRFGGLLEFHLYCDFKGMHKGYGFFDLFSESMLKKVLKLRRIKSIKFGDIFFFDSKIRTKKAILAEKKKNKKMDKKGPHFESSRKKSNETGCQSNPEVQQPSIRKSVFTSQIIEVHDVDASLIANIRQVSDRRQSNSTIYCVLRTPLIRSPW